MSKGSKVEVKLYKVLVDGKSCSGGALVWSLPTDKGPGDWHEVEGPLVQCRNGLHLTPDPSTVWREDAEAYLAEAEGIEIGVAGRDREVVARRVRLLRRLTWAELAAFGITPDGIDHRAKHQTTKAKRLYSAPPPPPEKGPSPAMRLVQTVWENRCGANEHSWRRVNQSMRAALYLAIAGGLSFAENDFHDIYKEMRGAYWFGDGEGFYRAAVEENHIQACVSYEKSTGRKPFVWEGKRLFVGASFPWAGEHVTVTSFDAASGTLTACSYKPKAAEDDYSTRIDHRFTISNDDLRRAERDRKVEIKVTAESTETQKALRDCGLFVDVAAIVAWTPEQRASAMEWARLAKHDAHKERVRPPAPPAHVAQATVAAEEQKRGDEIADLRRHIRDQEEDLREAEEVLATDRKRLAQLSAPTPRKTKKAA